MATSNILVHKVKCPAAGSNGNKILLRANLFDINIINSIKIQRYNINIERENLPRFINHLIFQSFINTHNYIFGNIKAVYDGQNTFYTNKKLPIECVHGVQLEVVVLENGVNVHYKITIKWLCEILLNSSANSLNASSSTSTSTTDNEIKMDSVNAVDVILRYLPSLTYHSIGRNFFSESTMNQCQYPLGAGREVWFGYHQSIKLANWKILVNIDVSATAFYKEQSVLNFMFDVLETNTFLNNNGQLLTEVQRNKFIKEIRGLRVEINYNNGFFRRRYRVYNITRKSANLQTFPLQYSNDRVIDCTVSKYFYDKYKIKLQYPKLQCLQVGKDIKHTYLPIELCNIVGGQRCLKKLTDLQTSAMIKATAKSAPERESEINKLIDAADFNNDENVNEFGLNVSKNMVKVEGRILPSPKLQYGYNNSNNIDNSNINTNNNDERRMSLAYPKYGVWDMRGKQFFIGIELQNWAIISFVSQYDLNAEKLTKFIKYLKQISNDAGMKIVNDPCAKEYLNILRATPTNIESFLIQLKEKHSNLQLFMIILPGKSSIYAEIKRIGDTVLGIVTQCIQVKNVLNTSPQTLSNICLKINVKLGGVNSILSPTIRSKIFDNPIIFLGADVTHPPVNDFRKPSIAAVVGSMDAYPSRYTSTIRIQHNQQQQQQQQQIPIKPQRDDNIRDLKNMVKELLLKFYQSTGFKPHRIIMYRNGITTEKFPYINKELLAMREACLELNIDYRPGITYIVVQKRHHTRLFCYNAKDGACRSGNVPAGTIVDTILTNPTDFDFYLCSHQGIQGTSRPSYYNVLWDDNNFESDELQCLTYQLCHTYARCTRSVSIPAPTYYAHLCAFRARYHLIEVERDTVVDVVERNVTVNHINQLMNEKIKIHSNIQNVMYFA